MWFNFNMNSLVIFVDENERIFFLRGFFFGIDILYRTDSDIYIEGLTHYEFSVSFIVLNFL